MNGKTYDFVVVGGGSAGYAGARTAARAGLRTAVIEGGAEVGGLCILRGCMPSKALIESANRYLTLRRAGEFGLAAGDISHDLGQIVDRKARLVGEFADYRRNQLEQGKFDFIRGRAQFTGEHALRVEGLDGGESEIGFRSALVSTGSSVAVPPVPGLADVPFLTSDHALELRELPPSLAVLGAGPVALEMAHYFSALGSEVTVIQRSPQVLKGIDPEAAEAVRAALVERGMRIFTDTKIESVREIGGRVEVRFTQGGETREVRAAKLLNALGREPNTRSLALERAGLKSERGLIETNLHQQTSCPHIFAAGDCCGPLEVVHIAIAQGEIAAHNAARVLRGEGGLESTDYRLKLFAVFTEPQVAAVGYFSEAEARAAGADVVSASYPFDDHGKSLVMGEPHGFVKLLADRRSGEIIGGTVVGPHASDLIHEIVVAMQFRATPAQLAAVPHYHPTLSEIWLYPAEELADSLAG